MTLSLIKVADVLGRMAVLKLQGRSNRLSGKDSDSARRAIHTALHAPRGNSQSPWAYGRHLSKGTIRATDPAHLGQVSGNGGSPQR